jgi:glycerophosphoryl diester phosphodiesterase
VHLSADGVPVVHHDATLERTTDASGPLSTRSAESLARIDAGHRFAIGGAFPFRRQGVGIPALRDVLHRYPDVRLIVEMKVDTAQMGEAVAREVRMAGAAERVCVAGYGRRSALAARAALPEMASSACHAEVRLAVCRGLIGWGGAGRASYGGYQVPERAGWLRIVSPRFVRQAHGEGLKVQVWTVDEEPDMNRLLHWGVDGLISNRPDVAVRVRNAATHT